MDKLTIPPRYRDEWKKMITGDINHKYSNFALQMALSQIKKEVTAGKIEMEEAVNKLHDLCTKYALACQRDFTLIFKTW